MCFQDTEASPPHVFFLGDSLEMSWINTGAVATEVIDDKAVAQWPLIDFVCDTRGDDSSGANSKESISVSAHIASPQPTTRCFLDKGLEVSFGMRPWPTHASPFAALMAARAASTSAIERGTGPGSEAVSATR